MSGEEQEKEENSFVGVVLDYLISADCGSFALLSSRRPSDADTLTRTPL